MKATIMRLPAMALLFGFMSGHVRGVVIPDDHGNLYDDATVLAGSSNAIAAVINYDTDVDVYSFAFLPARSYIIQIQTNTVWDLNLRIIPPARVPVIETNTVWTNAPVRYGWTNTGAVASWYLLASGQFQFTTGSYTLAVWEAPSGQDSDGDGLADSWEIQYYGSITNVSGSSTNGSSGISNLDAYYAGVNPNVGLQVTSISRSNTSDLVRWPFNAYGTYDIDVSTNLFGPWNYLGRNVAGNTSGLMIWTNDAPASTNQFYRVRFRY